jgi:hypothetical protein
MSRRSDLLDACFFGNRWSANTTAAGTTVAPQSPAGAGIIQSQSRPHMEMLCYSFINETGAGAANITVTAQVRNASVAGTVLWSQQHLIAPSTSANVQIVCMGLPGKRGFPIVATTNTVVASLSASISIAGWYEDTNG